MGVTQEKIHDGKKVKKAGLDVIVKDDFSVLDRKNKGQFKWNKHVGH